MNFFIQRSAWLAGVRNVPLVITNKFSDSPRRYILLHWVSFLISLVGICSLVAARGHYSIDDLLAYFVTSRQWWIYPPWPPTTTSRSAAKRTSSPEPGGSTFSGILNRLYPAIFQGGTHSGPGLCEEGLAKHQEVPVLQTMT